MNPYFIVSLFALLQFLFGYGVFLKWEKITVDSGFALLASYIISTFLWMVTTFYLLGYKI